MESFQTDTSGPVLSTDKWLEYRDQVAPDTTTFPVRWPAASQVSREREYHHHPVLTVNIADERAA